MMPGNELSSQTVHDLFENPRNTTKLPLVDYEIGGVAIGDVSQGLDVKVWTATVVDNMFIELSAEGVTPFNVIVGAEITEVSLTFDQLMRPCLGYVEALQAKLYWWDTVAAAFVVTNLPVDAINPRVCLDDRRPSQSSNSDIILAFISNEKLIMRIQRDRFEVDYELDDVGGANLVQIGKNRVGRFQFRIQP